MADQYDELASDVINYLFLAYFYIYHHDYDNAPPELVNLLANYLRTRRGVPDVDPADV